MRVFGEKVFFEIPIYRCSKETHADLIDSKIAENFDNRGILTNIALEQEEIIYGFWYNEIIGYICLYILGQQLRGDYYMECSKRKRSGIRKKNFKHIGKAFELHINSEMTSEDIFKELIKEIHRINKADFRGRFIDIEVLANSGKYINWKLLASDFNVFKHMKDN